MADELENKIIRQIEYYFGDINLPRDKFMQKKLEEDDGWIALDVLLTFKRLASLTTDKTVITAAVEKSDLVVVSEDKQKLRRNPDLPVPELNDERRKELTGRTAYAKGFPTDLELNEIMSFLEPHGPIESCFRRTSKDHKFIGSCYIIFKDIDTCKKFIEQENLKYKDTELIRKWQSEHLAEKKKEFEERQKSKKDKKEKKQKVVDETEQNKIEYPKGAVVHFSGIPEGQSLTREDIREKVNKVGDVSVSFIDFNKGDLEGFIRLSKENAAGDLLEKLTDSELEVGDVKLKFRKLEGEEEEEFLKKQVVAVNKLRQQQKMFRNNRKRRGNYNNKDNNKRQKAD